MTPNLRRSGTFYSLIVIITILILIYKLYGLANPIQNPLPPSIPSKDVRPTIDPEIRVLPDIEPPSGIAVIVEWRACSNIASVIFNAIDNLPQNWKIQIFYGNSNQNFVTNHPKLLKLYKNGKLKFTKISETFLPKDSKQSAIDSYNQLLISYWFWEQISEENILIFQTDSRFCSNSPHGIEDFIDYAYIGAPWHFTEKFGVGNGGLSFRKKSIMLKILSVRDEIIDYIDTHGVNTAEDLLFSAGTYYLSTLDPNIKYPTKEIASTFSQEYYEGWDFDNYLPTFGIHHGSKFPDRFYKWCPELRDLRPKCEQVSDMDYESLWNIKKEVKEES